MRIEFEKCTETFIDCNAYITSACHATGAETLGRIMLIFLMTKICSKQVVHIHYAGIVQVLHGPTCGFVMMEITCSQ